MSINIPKLRGKMAEKGLTMTSTAESLGISRNTLSAYFEDPGRMPYRIIEGLADLLCEDSKEAGEIFFTPNLRNT